MTATKRFFMLAAALVVLVGGGLALQSHHDAVASVPAPPMPPTSVGVMTVRDQPVQTWSEFSGRLRAIDYAEIRPEVSGKIVAIKLKDGQIVKAGDVLFVIDPAPYQAAVEKAQADLASAQTNASFAKTELDRADGLIADHAISRSLYDQRGNANRVAEAATQGAQAELTQAKLNLDHAFVKAPISGRVSRAELTVGNLVQASVNAPILTSIASNEGIYADFEIDERTYLQDIRTQSAAGQEIPVTLVVPGDEAHAYKGVIASFDNRIDTATGTIRARALFDNKDASLMPGMTVAVRVADAAVNGALLVPQASVNIDQDKKFVYVVGSDSKVIYREVTLGKQVDDKRVVLSGLKPGDRVIVDGMQHVHPDAMVAAKEVAALQPAAGDKP